MGVFTYVKDIATIVSIVSLILVGVYITLKSGVMARTGDRCRLLMANVSQLVISLAACTVVLVMVQQLVGLRIAPQW